MGYPIQANAPTVTDGGKTYAVGGFKANTMIGTEYAAGVFVQNNGWDIYNCPALYINANDFTHDIQAKGGITPFLKWLNAQINALFATHSIAAVFTIPAGAFAEPTTDDESLAAVQLAINTGKFEGHEIPAQLRADFDAYWTAAIPVGDSRIFANGSITKLGVCLGLYADPAGVLMAIPPNADLNAVAKANRNIAQAWKDAYGWTPQ